MAAIKSYTDIEQSKKLAEILPIESADMYYPYNGIETYPDVKNGLETETALYCWSLAALLGVLPEGYSFELVKSFDEKDYYCKIDSKPIETIADNPVDACYEMILKLHELNLL